MLKLSAFAGQFYYGWTMLLAVSGAEVVSWGILYYAFTVFVAPIQAEQGWSRTAITGAFSLALLVAGVVGIGVGRWLDRYGARGLMTFGACAATMLVSAWSQVHDLTQFYLIWVGIGVTLAMVLYEPAFVIVATWFVRKRGRALTILTFIGGFASVIFIPLAQFLVAELGWRGALVALAVILAVVTIPLPAIFVRRHPQDLGLLPDGAVLSSDALDASTQRERSIPLTIALHDKSFWILTAAFFLNTLGIGAIFVHIVPYLNDEGYSPTFAATAVGLIGVMALPGRVVLTPLGDRIPRRLVAAAIFGLQALGLLVLLLIPGPLGIWSFVILVGAGFGAVTPARAAMVAQLYGPLYYGRISSVVGICLTGARALAPVGIGTLRDWIGSYTPVFWLLFVLSVIATGLILMIKMPRAAA